MLLEGVGNFKAMLKSYVYCQHLYTGNGSFPDIAFDVSNDAIWLPRLRLTPDGGVPMGVPGWDDLRVQFCTEVSQWLGYKIA